MTQKEHEEMLAKVQEILGKDTFFFLSYVNSETGEGMSVKKGDEMAIAKSMYYSILSNYGRESAMTLLNILQNTMLNLMMSVPEIKANFINGIKQAESQQNKQAKEIPMGN